MHTRVNFRLDAALVDLHLDGAVGLLLGADHLGLQHLVHALLLQNALELLGRVKVDPCAS